LIVLQIGGYSNFNGGVLSVSGGGLTWTVDVVLDSFLFGAIASAPAPSGLSSSTTITVTLDAALAPCMISAASFSGVDQTGGRLADSDSGTADTTATWTTPTMTATAGDLVVGLAFGSGNGTSTSTPDGAYTELHDFTSAGQDELTSVYGVAASGSVAPNGTWSGTPDTELMVGAVYLQGAAAGGASILFPHRMS
jgi:hypothetical protein